MTKINLKEDLDSYLAKNETPPISEKLLNSLNGLKPANLFSTVKYSRVPTDESSASNGWFNTSTNEDSKCCPTLSRVQRLTLFCICVALGLFFFGSSAFLVPFLIVKARKFSLLFTLGSLFMVFSFSFLWGPVNHLKHLFSLDRFMFTFTYFGTLILTLYFAMAVQSTPWTVVFAVLQVIALIWFLLSYIPGGHTGLKFFTQLCKSSITNSVSKTFPV
ncbi:UNVERIFIED_CONTAM: hypothetical protein PYX00_009951 [Menopon gallinae]|uniref:Vesicle transport protein n=1 Tax=Menopon gallinae TaxID=328185 RepID=A0AAW2HDG3_9NEOP